MAVSHACSSKQTFACAFSSVSSHANSGPRAKFLSGSCALPSLCVKFPSFRSTAFQQKIDFRCIAIGPSKFSVRAEVETSEDAPAKSSRPRPGEKKGFVEEMRIRAMKLHTRDQSKEGEKEAQKPLAKWEPTIKGYIQFLVDSKLVYDTMESIVDKATHPLYVNFRNTGLERSAALAKDLEWFESQGHEIPQPDTVGSEYARYLSDISESDPPSFICHYYNVYFAHSAGGRMIGRKVSEMVLDGRELNFYKWEGELPELLSAVKDQLNVASQEWTREEKDRCLNETELSFKYSGSILRLLAQ